MSVASGESLLPARPWDSWFLGFVFRINLVNAMLVILMIQSLQCLKLSGMAKDLSTTNSNLSGSHHHGFGNLAEDTVPSVFVCTS